jgi:tetratricopeptide (TPR) repeat protein
MPWTRTWLTATRSVLAGTDRRSVAGRQAPASARHVLVGLLAGSAIAATAAVDGGYFPVAWGWSALALLLTVAAMLIVADRIDFARLDVAFLIGLSGLVLWVALSSLWSQSTPRTLLEVERGVVYVAGAAALLLLARRCASAWIAGGLLAAVTSVAAYALATRLFPDRFGYDFESGYQLARPLGYWNALGILAALGILLALGFATSSGRLLPAAAAATLPVLVATLYFTFSRGALVALAVGLATMVAAEPRRLRLGAIGLALAPLPAVAVALSSRSEGLAREQAPLDVASREGHRLAAAIVVLAAASALLRAGFERVARTVTVAPRTERTVGRAVLALCAAAAVGGLIAAGGPVSLATRAYDSFRAPLPSTGGELEGRLFSVSGNGREDYWRVALDAYREHPVLGSGAGTYELHWARERPTAFDARDAHSLYLETLAELGPVGLALVLVALAIPLLALRRARRRPLVAAVAGGYAAYLTHAALDWDWELPAVTLAGLACAAALLVAARRPADERPLRGRLRSVGLAAAAVPAAFAFVAYVGNSALAVSSDTAAEGRYERSAAEARRASRWTPWASDPWEALGEARLARGDDAGARDSFRRAIAKDPRDWNLWYGLARASDGAQRTAALARARSLNPRSTELDALEPG